MRPARPIRCRWCPCGVCFAEQWAFADALNSAPRQLSTGCAAIDRLLCGGAHLVGNLHSRTRRIGSALITPPACCRRMRLRRHEAHYSALHRHSAAQRGARQDDIAHRHRRIRQPLACLPSRSHAAWLYSRALAEGCSCGLASISVPLIGS